MRVAFYTHPAFFEPALHLIRELAREVELHVLIEVTPWTWRQAGFDVPALDLPGGLVPADTVLRDYLPPRVRSFWADAADVQLVVHRRPRALVPAAWRVTQQVLRFLRGVRPDVLHVEDPDESLRLALGVPWRLDTPVVLSVHDPAPHTGEANRRKDAARWLMFKRTSHYILHNRQDKGAFCHRYHVPPELVTLSRLGSYDVFREWMQPGTIQDEHTVLFFGRLSPYKGLEVLYQAALRVAALVPGVRFVIAGRPVAGYCPPPPPALPNGGQLDIRTDYVSNTQLAALFQQATVVACPYIDATQSGVVLTAYAFERPVVATRVGGLPEYVGDRQSGLLVPPGDAEALALALTEVLTNAPLRARLQAGIIERKSGDLAWNTAARATLDVYQGVLRRCRSR
jgi:glycosyltransferase involved in cell wall biosynthesis